MYYIEPQSRVLMREKPLKSGKDQGELTSGDVLDKTGRLGAVNQ